MLIIQQDEDDLKRALALQAHGQGREAQELCRRILLRSPKHGGALHLMGILALQRGAAAEAAGFLERSLEIRPEAACAIHLGMAYRELGEFERAVRANERALALAPEHPATWLHLGISLAQANRHGAARQWLEKAAAACPNDAEVMQNFGTFCVEVHEYERALEICRRGLELDPKRAMLWIVMQKAYTGMGRFAEAEEAVARALALEQSAGVYKALAHARTSAGEMEKALEPAEKAVLLAPNHPLYHFDRGVVLLTLGRFEEGWKEYEWRRALPEIRRAAPKLTGAEWGGEALEGKRILLYAEQGFGDAIQFVRYVPLVRQRGGRVMVECQNELKRLIGGMEGVEVCVGPGEERPGYEVYCPLLSLGRIFGTTEGAIPADVPYLRAQAEDAAKWRERMAGERRLKVGLSWAGRPTHMNDRTRSVSAEEMAELVRGAGEGVAFYSLQKGMGAKAMRPLLEAGMVDWTGELLDFADTAGLAANLDWVITVDTAVAHLAGAMNVRTWVLVALASDWRWGMEREDSAWYPSMRLFRQKGFRDWASVLTRVTEELWKLTPP